MNADQNDWILGNYSVLKVKLLTTPEEGIWLLTIHRPESLNALNSQVLKELDQFITEFSKIPLDKAKVLVLTGAGEKAFVAGADIKEIHSLTEQEAQIFSRRGQEIFRKLEKLTVPVIAAVNGFALGGGLELALSCDFILASKKSQFGLPEVTLGLIPGFGGTARLTRAIGLQKSREMIFSGLMIHSTEAFNFGLVNHVYENEDFMEEVTKCAQTIAKRGPVAISRAKYLCQASVSTSIDLANDMESQEFGKLFLGQDAKEGTLAFIEKRKPRFLGN